MTRGIACAGNWIVDIVQTIDAWPRKSDLVHIRHEVTGVGGGAANVALDLAAFQTGLALFAVGLVGRDTHAQICRDACARAGVDTRWLLTTESAPTAHTQVMNVPSDSRTFFYHPGCNDALSEADIPIEAMADAGVGLFYLGYLNLLAGLDALDAGGGTGAARILARARAVGMVTCVDLVSSDNPSFAATVAAALPHIDHLFLNEVEAERATGIAVSGTNRAQMLAAAQALRAGGAGCVVLHSGALALWLDDAALWSVPDPVDAAAILSPVGAGDAFCAGVIYGIHQGWPAEQAMRLGHRAAAASLQGATATDGIPPLAELMAG